MPYSREPFGVPDNLDIYGTMNTADRSISLLDTALRRRFQFKELMPDANFIAGSTGEGMIDDGEGGNIDLRQLLNAMNQRIRFLINRDLILDHAYLCKIKTFSELKAIFINQFVLLLQEYFYDDWNKIQLVFKDIEPNGNQILTAIVGHSIRDGTYARKAQKCIWPSGEITMISPLFCKILGFFKLCSVNLFICRSSTLTDLAGS